MEKKSSCSLGIYLLSLCVLIVGAWIGWYLQRLPSSPVRGHRPLASGSMATAEPGPHFKIRCHDCRMTYLCDVTTVSAENSPVCFNCGATNSIEGLPGHTHQVAYEAGPIQRWSKVVFQSSGTPPEQTMMLKRVVGMPNESIQIDHGELWINRRIYQKSIEEFDRFRIPVFDSRYRPQDTRFSFLKRFAVAPNEQGWIITSTGEFAFDDDEKRAPQWLEYIHWNAIPGFVPKVPRGMPTAIFDYQPYNQYISRPQLHFVDDYVVDVAISTRSVPAFWLRLQDVEIEINLEAKTVIAYQGAHVCGSHSLTVDDLNPAAPFQLRVGRLDQRIVIQVKSETIYFDFTPIRPSGHFEEDELLRQRPFAIGAAAGYLDVQSILIARDIYWLNPQGQDDFWEFAGEIPPATFFVAGDNQPVSEDSRHWQHGVSQSAIHGIVVESGLERGYE